MARILLLLCILLAVLATSSESSVTVHEGDLRQQSCFMAILGMDGDSSHKSIWWQFLPYLQSSTRQAFLGYLISSFTGRNLNLEVKDKGALAATRNASLIEHQSEETIKSLGKIKITLWALGFVCLDLASGSCTKLTPVVIQAIPGSNGMFGFFSLWEVEDGVLSNTVGSKVLTLPNWSMHQEKFSRMTLRTIESSARLPLCKDLELDPATFNQSIVELRGESLNRADFDVRTAPEAAGFDLSRQTVFSSRPRRNLCLLGADNSSTSNTDFDLRSTTTLVDVLGSFLSHVRNSYIQAQKSELDLRYPASEFWVAAVALPSSFIAVVAAAVPLINLQFRLFRNLTNHQRWKTALLCVMNPIVSTVSYYSAVIAVTPSETKRQEEFGTWGLLADQVPITRRGLQVLVVVQAESLYRSASLIFAWCSTVVLIPVVACITYYRCRQVFHRRRLIKASGSDKPGDERICDLQAIEMSSAEQKRLEKKLETAKSLERRDQQLKNFVTYRRTRSLA